MPTVRIFYESQILKTCANELFITSGRPLHNFQVIFVLHNYGLIYLGSDCQAVNYYLTIRPFIVQYSQKITYGTILSGRLDDLSFRVRVINPNHGSFSELLPKFSSPALNSRPYFTGCRPEALLNSDFKFISVVFKLLFCSYTCIISTAGGSDPIFVP